MTGLCPEFPAPAQNPSNGGPSGGAGIRTRTTFPAAFLVTPDGLTPAPPECEQRWRTLPKVTLKKWLADQPHRPDCDPARKPRITEKGYRAGCKPGNAGRVYEYTPPTDADILALKAACPTNRLYGQRNRAAIAGLRGTGLRIHELLLLLDSDIDFEAGTVLVRRGKGGKRRKVGVMGDALPELQAWIDSRTDAGFTPDQPLFCTVEGKTKGGSLYQAYFRTALHNLCADAGIEKRITPHGLRHALALDMARRGIPLPVIARQLGHSNVSTTATYLRGLSDDEVFDTLASMTLQAEATGPVIEEPPLPKLWVPGMAA